MIHLPYLALDEIQDKLELNLTGAHFSGANLFNANLTGDKLSGANLTGVDLSVLIFLTP